LIGEVGTLVAVWVGVGATLCGIETLGAGALAPLEPPHAATAPRTARPTTDPTT